VVAIQRGEPIFNLSASFHKFEEGVSHQSQMPIVPNPLSLPTLKERVAPWEDQLGDWNARLRPLDLRYVDPPTMEIYDQPREPKQRVWVKADGELPDDLLLHACVVTYASDMTLLDSVMLPHKLSWINKNLMVASIDHVMWFHRPIRADQWFLYDQDSPTAYGARAFARGQIYASDGTLAVSVAQEGLLRILKPKS
jgi:acyl-CoA thioesterase-2